MDIAITLQYIAPQLARSVTRWLERKDKLLSHIKSRKLRYCGLMMRIPHDSIEASTMTGLAEGVRNRGRPGICWIDNIITWTGQSDPYSSHETEGVGRH